MSSSVQPAADTADFLAQFDTRSLEGETFAAIDLGSNSFHAVIARYEHGTLHVIDRLKEMVRLAEGVDRDGRLSSAVEQRALKCLARFGERIRALPAGNVRAVGTNALRQMRDGWKFLDQAEARLGQPIEIVSGQEEARLIYLGVAHGISERGNQRLVIDIGGGSTEFVVGRDFSPVMLESLYFGCVGIAQRYFPDGKITEKRWHKAHTAVAVELQRIADAFRACGWQEVLGSSGTMKAVRNVVVAQQWSERGITPASIVQLRERLLQAGATEDLSLAGLSARRRPVFASGVVIIEACLQLLDIDRIIVTDYALREGLLYDMLGRILHSDPRRGSVDAIAERYRTDRGQGQRVRQVGLALFDQVRDHWRLSDNARDLLGWACDLHEIGLNISHHGYHRHGAYLIENSDLPGFSRLEQLTLAIMIRNHRRKPDPGLYDRLIARVQTDVRRLTSLLRLAVLLNRTRSDRGIDGLAARAADDRLILSVPSRWLERHPLARADLKEEARLLERIEVKLQVE